MYIQAHDCRAAAWLLQETTNLAVYQDFLTVNMEKGCQIDVSYMDQRYSRACVVDKLHAMTSCGDLLTNINFRVINRPTRLQSYS